MARHPPGEQMFRCLDCQSREAWNDMIKMTIAGDSLQAVSLALGINVATAFRMRHKLLCSLEEEETTAMLTEQVELDEKYFPKSHKGKKLGDAAGKKRGAPSSRRGLSNERYRYLRARAEPRRRCLLFRPRDGVSHLAFPALAPERNHHDDSFPLAPLGNDQVCLLLGVQRSGGSYLRSFNMARPTSEEVMNLHPHIEAKNYIWTDDCASYNKLIAVLGSDRKVVLTHKDYDKVNPLNNVNSSHSLIEKWYRRMGGVASKYINRYAALFNIRFQVCMMDPSEALLLVRSRLRGIGGNNFVTIERLKHEKLFNPPELRWGEGVTA